MLQLVKDKSMDYNSFVSLIRRIVTDRMGNGYSVRIYKVIKNNSLELDSLVVLKEGKNYAPNIYLMPYYESYLSGTPIGEIADRLCMLYGNCPVPITEDNFRYSFGDMKPYIFYRLVSYDRNLKLLNQIPHIKYLDLAVTFHCLVRNDDEGIGTIRITNEHVKLWDTSVEELEKLASENTRRLFPATINSMEEVLKGALYGEHYSKDTDYRAEAELDSLFIKTSPQQHKMYILTNQKGINGASCILYKDTIKGFADRMASDLYILPSSIHEIILVPKTNYFNKAALSKMVEEVNLTQVAAEEVLSDKVYIYSRELDSIMM